MRIRFDTRRLAIAPVILAVAVVSLGTAWASWSTSPSERCVRPDVSNDAIRECVAAEAGATESSVATLIPLLIGVAALAGSIVIGTGAARRVMTVTEAASELQLQPGEVRRLVDEGVLRDLRPRTRGGLSTS
jgi:hypothetical protein